MKRPGSAVYTTVFHITLMLASVHQKQEVKGQGRNRLKFKVETGQRSLQDQVEHQHRSKLKVTAETG